MKKIRTLLAAFSLVAFGLTSSYAQPFISEIVDGPLTGGLPKFFELTNGTGSSIADLSIYDVARGSNGAATWSANTQLNAVSLADGASYVFASESSTFTTTYGFAPDQTGSVAGNNGDDDIGLLLTGGTTIVDMYGVLGTDGTGEVWEYLDSFVNRAFSVTGPNATFTFPSEWVNAAVNVGDGEDATWVVANTSPGSHSFVPVELSTFVIE